MIGAINIDCDEYCDIEISSFNGIDVLIQQETKDDGGRVNNIVFDKKSISFIIDALQTIYKQNYKKENKNV